MGTFQAYLQCSDGYGRTFQKCLSCFGCCEMNHSTGTGKTLRTNQFPHFPTDHKLSRCAWSYRLLSEIVLAPTPTTRRHLGRLEPLPSDVSFRNLLSRCPSAAFSAGLANFNAQEGYIIRKNSPDGRTYIYIYRKTRPLN